MAWRDEEWRGPSDDQPQGEEGHVAGRVAPGRRALTQTIGSSSGSSATPAPGKVSLTQRLPHRDEEGVRPIALPYRDQMEAAFGADFSTVRASETGRDGLGGSRGLAWGEEVAFAGPPSMKTVAHELAHVVQHREGETSEPLADNGTSVLDKLADKVAEAATDYNTGRARLPRPLVIEVIGDRFTVTCKADAMNRLVLLVRYDGPYQAEGEYVEERTVRLPCHRLEGKEATPLDVSVLKIQERGVLFDLSGTGEEIAELTFTPKPHDTDPDARTHRLKTRTSGRDGWSYPIDILLPNDSRPAPEGIEGSELDREGVTSCLVALGMDSFQLRARRLGASSSVHLRFDADAGGEQHGNRNLVVPIASPDAPVRVGLVAQSPGELLVDLDGDGASDVRLVHTAAAREPDEDGGQVHEHTVHAYDVNDVRVARTLFSVAGESWDVPPELDAGDNPPPASAATPIEQGATQDDHPTEGSQPMRLDGGDWEIRVDGDGDRRKELLFRFHQEDWGAPVSITAIQISSGQSVSFSAQASAENDPAHMDPVLTAAADGASPAEIQLFGSIMGGDFIWLEIDPPADDGERRSYQLRVVSGSEITAHDAEFASEEAAGNPLALDAVTRETVAGVRSLEARIGELGDPFLFTVEQAPGGLTLGIAGLAADGTTAGASGHRLRDIEVLGLSMVGVSTTQVGLDLTGDGKADIVIHDAISQPLGRPASRQLSVERQHRMTLSGPAMVDTGTASFMLSGRDFRPTSDPSVESREAAGAAGAVTAIGQQRKEGGDVDQLIGRYRAGVSAQIVAAGDKGILSAQMVSAWKGLAEEMIRLEVYAAAEPDARAALAASEGEVRKSAAAHAETLYAELEAAAGGEKGRRTDDGWENPYTGAPLDESHETLEHGLHGLSTFSQLEPGPAAKLGAAISAGNDLFARLLWHRLQDGVERWAQTRLQRELGASDPLVMQGRYMSAMAGALTEIRSKPRLMRVFATFMPDECYRGEEGFVPSLPLQLWVWQDEDGGTWHIRDLTNPEKPFDGEADPEYWRTCNPEDRPADLPPHGLFRQLDDEKKYPKGLIRYEIPGGEWNYSNRVVCHADMKWYQWAQWAGLGLALVGITLATAGTASPVVAAIGSYALAASAVAGAVGAAGELADAAQHGWLDGALLTVNLLQIVSGVASAGSIVAGRLVQGARAASMTAGARPWTGDLARLASLGGKVYVPLTKGAIAADVTSVVVMAVDLKNKLDEVDQALPARSERDEAKVKLIAMFAVAGGLTILSVKGDLPTLEQGKATVVLDTVNGIPVAHAGGVRAGGVELDVAGPELHATARWTGQDPGALALSDAELPWYRAWMQQEHKLRFGPTGEPEIRMPELALEKPPGIEAKLAAIAKSSDLARLDAAWARTADLEALREANGGHLDIDPTSPAWPAERTKLRDELTRSLGSKRKAEEMLSRYEALRTGRFGPDEALHAAQAGRIGQVLPPGEVDAIRRLYPECEVYVSGDVVSQGGAAEVATIEVVVVVARDTAPDLMGAMEARAGGLSLRPDPDYLAAHPAAGTNRTIRVRVKAVTPEQLFGLATVRVGDGPPLDLHRVDIPTGPGGQPYAGADLDAMHKAGYEYDPATGQFAPRSAQTRAGLVGTAFGALRGANTICGGPLPSEVIGQEVLRKLALGDAEALRVVGVEPKAGFDPRGNEWGLGQRVSDDTWVLVRGSAGSVDWSKIPDVKARGHSHPILDPFTGTPRALTGAGGADWISIDDLIAGKGGHSLMYLAPSASDLSFAAREGRHMVATPYVHLGGGRIGTPKPGGLDPVVEFDIVTSTAEGVWMGGIVAYRSRVVIRAGDEVLYRGDLWGMQTGAGSLVQFDRPEGLTRLPDDFEVGRWNIRKSADDAAGGATGTGSARLLERLRKVGLPDIGNPVMAQLMARMDDVTEAHFHRLLDLQEKGTATGMREWFDGVERDPSPNRVGNMMAEVRQFSLMSYERPGRTIDLSPDRRAPNKHRQRADGTWEEVLDERGRTQKDSSFDGEIAYGDEVARSVEVKTIAAPVQKPDELQGPLKETARKILSRAANKPGLEIPGRKELRLEIELFHGEEVSGNIKRIYDGAGKITTTDHTGRVVPLKDGRPNVVSLYDQIAYYLSRNESAATLDRISLADRTGLLAEFDNEGGRFIRVQ